MVRPILNPEIITVPEAERRLGMHGKSPEAVARRKRFEDALDKLLTREKMTNKASVGKPQFEAILKLIYLFDFLPEDIRGTLFLP